MESPQVPPAPEKAWRSKLPSLAILVLLLGATVFFALFVHPFYPLQHWLFFIYAKYWGYTALFGLACLSSGFAALKRLLPEPPVLLERVTLAMGLGVLIFFLGTFVAGILGLFGMVFFFAWPLILIASGARDLWATALRVRRQLGRLGPGALYPRTPLQLASLALLILGITVIYLFVIVPLNIGGDSHWYHLPIAERYAALGKITRFDEGWYLGVYPQLASVLYAWGFQSPGGLTDHTNLCAHLEWFLFLVTLVGLSPLVRRLLPGRRVPWAGAAFFLFPGFLLYDSSLISGADHVLAFWAPALGIALVRCGVNFDKRNAVLASALLSGALLTKYQASYFLVPATLLLVILVAKTRRFSVAGLALLVCVVLTTPHWLKNLLYYHDPLYPLLHGVLPSRPFHPGAAKLIEDIYLPRNFLLSGTPWEKLRDTLVSLVSFSFVPHDWDFHGQKPIFGSLFTLSLVALPFVKLAKRVWLLVLAVHLGIATWFLTAHEDRFLQALLPWMVACTVVLLASLWRQRPLARAGIIPLVAFQLVWGSDVAFFRTHGMIGDSPLKLAVDLIASGNQKRYDRDDRLRIAGEIQDVRDRVPKDAVLLLHQYLGLLGAGHAIVNDAAGWQGAYEYLNHENPEESVAMWRAMGVTHIVREARRGGASPEEMAREAAFLRAADRYSEQPFSVRNFTVTQLKKEDPPGSPGPTRIAWLACGERTTGIFTPRGLAENHPRQELRDLKDATPLELKEKLATANAVILRPHCNELPAANQLVEVTFRQVLAAGDTFVYIR